MRFFFCESSAFAAASACVISRKCGKLGIDSMRMRLPAGSAAFRAVMAVCS